MIDYYESPAIYGRPSLFLGGGISGCPDWQADMVKQLNSLGSELVLVNPRSTKFDVKNKDRTLTQIQWEYQMLRRVDGILFWFAEETIQPIVLFELGAHLMIPGKPIFIGMHPEYSRRVDVEVQTSIIRPDLEIVYSLSALAGQIIAWESRFKQTPLYQPPAQPVFSEELQHRAEATKMPKGVKISPSKESYLLGDPTDGGRFEVKPPEPIAPGDAYNPRKMD